MAIALAGIIAFSTVELTNVVLIFVRLKLTCDPGLVCEPCTNPVPFTVSVNAGSPEVVLMGDMLETENGGGGGTIVSVAVLEVPPPGTPFDGVVTEILAVPCATI
jgi:hypothetical protein